MSDIDAEIIRTADRWTREDHAQRTARQRRRLWALFGSVCVLSLTLGVAWLIPTCAQLRREKETEHERQQQLDEQRHLAQEQAWIDCVAALDVARCDLIESRLAERCLAHSEMHGDRHRCLTAEVAP